MNNTARQLKLEIAGVNKIKADVFLLSLNSAYLSRTAQPGNFLHIRVDGVILRRPFSIHKIYNNTVSVLFKVKGTGTRALAKYKKGMSLDVIGPLGKGFVISPQSIVHSPQILVAGGIGVAPLVFLAEKLRGIQNPKSKIQNLVLLGAKNKNEILCEKDFKHLGYKVLIATDDGSRGFKGTVTHLLKNKLSAIDHRLSTNIYACGPEAMFKAIAAAIKKYPNVDCQVSFEQFMGCGLGVCCACVIKTKHGYKKVCKDGPVFDLRDVW